MRKIFPIIILLFLVSIFSSQAADIFIMINETGKVISYYDDYYVVTVTGTINVSNPSPFAFNNIRIYYDLGSLIITNTNDNKYGVMHNEEFIIYMLESNTSTVFDYQIIGIETYNPMVSDEGVLISAIDQNRTMIDSNILTNLKKAEMENENITGRPGRVVSIRVDNPTSYTYNVSSVEVIKTADMDVNSVIEKWTFPDPGTEVTITPYGSFQRDILDKNSTPDSVYWVKANIYIINILDIVLLNSSDTVLYYTEEDLYVPEFIEINGTEERTNFTLLEQEMFIRKKISQSLMMPGDTVDITLIVNNLGSTLRDVEVRDFIPYGFELLSSEGTLSGDTLTLTDNVNPYNAKIFRYTLQYTDQDSLGLDYFKPAELYYEDKLVYSQSVAFIRQYIPEKTLYIQKKLRYAVNDEIEVIIEVKNMGEGSVDNLILKEFLSSEAVFREITQPPDARGVWSIPVIKSGEIWTVSYLTNEEETVNLMPEIYGLDSSYVLKSLVLENVIHSRMELSGIRVIEVLGIIILISVPVLAFSIRKHKKKRKIKHISHIQRDIDILKRETKPDHHALLKKLKSESKPKDQKGFKSIFSRFKFKPSGSREKYNKNEDHIKKLKENFDDQP